MSIELWLLFVTTTFFVSATPGPNMLLAMNHGIHFGIRNTVSSTCLGLMTGLACYLLLSAAGLSALLESSPLLFTLVRYIGATYLVWLGIRTWRAEPLLPSQQDTGKGSQSNRFHNGFWVALSNPKAILFFAALFPQFINDKAAKWPQLLILTVSFYLIEAAWQFVYASSGASLAHWLQSAKHVRLVNRLSACAFIGAALFLSLFSHH